MGGGWLCSHSHGQAQPVSPSGLPRGCAVSGPTEGVGLFRVAVTGGEKFRHFSHRGVGRAKRMCVTRAYWDIAEREQS